MMVAAVMEGDLAAPAMASKCELDFVDRFHTGFMAAARFDIAAYDVEAGPLLADLEVIGLLSVAPALSELGVERLADVEELSDEDLQSVGIRLVQRKLLRQALVQDAGAGVPLANAPALPEPGPEPLSTLPAVGLAEQRGDGQALVDILSCMAGVLKQVILALSGDAVLAIGIESALAEQVAAVSGQLAALELVFAARGLVERDPVMRAALSGGMRPVLPGVVNAVQAGHPELGEDNAAAKALAPAIQPESQAPLEPSPTPFDLPRPPEAALTGAPRASDQNGESVLEAQFEARLADLQRELEAARLAVSSARQELEDQRAALLEESSSAQRLAQAEAEAQRAVAKLDSAVRGARLQEIQDSADVAQGAQEKQHSSLHVGSVAISSSADSACEVPLEPSPAPFDLPRPPEALGPVCGGAALAGAEGEAPIAEVLNAVALTAEVLAAEAADVLAAWLQRRAPVPHAPS